MCWLKLLFDRESVVANFLRRKITICLQSFDDFKWGCTLTAYAERSDLRGRASDSKKNWKKIRTVAVASEKVRIKYWGHFGNGGATREPWQVLFYKKPLKYLRIAKLTLIFFYDPTLIKKVKLCKNNMYIYIHILTYLRKLLTAVLLNRQKFQPL